jgi:hypothetical protein
MTPLQGNWADVGPGVYIQGSDGSAWRCDARWGVSSYRLTNRAGQQLDVTRDPWSGVTILVPTIEDAVGLVQRILDGTLIQEEA